MNIDPSVWIGKNTIIKPTAIIEAGCSIGDDCFIGNYTVIRPNTIIGNRTRIGHMVVMEGDTSIGDDCLIESQCHLTKGLIIEDKVFMGPACCTTNDKTMVHLRRHVHEFVPNAPIIRKGARIGGATSILPGVIIGASSVVGNNSLVTRDVPDNTVVFGQPARVRSMVPNNMRV